MTHPRARRTVATVCAVAGLVSISALVGACGTDDERADAPAEQVDAVDPETPDRGWVGHVDDTTAFAAVVAGGGRIVAYVCDGDAGIAEWFSGDTGDDGTFALTSRSGATMSGRESADQITGELDLGDGASHRFTLDRSEPGAGLYRVEDPAADRDGVNAGWIVDNHGDQRGSLRIGTVTRSAPALPGSTLTVNDASYGVVVYSVPTRPTPSAPAPVPTPYPFTDKGS